MGTLYLVATPIGNLEDVTLRALRVLGEVSVVAAEDTRTTRKLLSHHGIHQRLLSYNEHNMKARTPQLLTALDSGDIAFASEAGTPGVSDPGYELVQAALEAEHEVVAVPGASALLTALAASGLPMREFTFLGFLPRKAGERRRLLEALVLEPKTLVFFESPHRIKKTLEDVLETLGDRQVAVVAGVDEGARGSVPGECVAGVDALHRAAGRVHDRARGRDGHPRCKSGSRSGRARKTRTAAIRGGEGT